MRDEENQEGANAVLEAKVKNITHHKGGLGNGQQGNINRQTWKGPDR
jgi:hypothetical protein